MDAAPVEMKVDQRTKNITRGAKRRRTHRLSRKHFAHEVPRPGAHALGNPSTPASPSRAPSLTQYQGERPSSEKAGAQPAALRTAISNSRSAGLHGVALVERQRMDSP